MEELQTISSLLNFSSVTTSPPAYTILHARRRLSILSSHPYSNGDVYVGHSFKPDATSIQLSREKFTAVPMAVVRNAIDIRDRPDYTPRNLSKPRGAGTSATTK